MSHKRHLDIVANATRMKTEHNVTFLRVFLYPQKMAGAPVLASAFVHGPGWAALALPIPKRTGGPRGPQIGPDCAMRNVGKSVKDRKRQANCRQAKASHVGFSVVVQWSLNVTTAPINNPRVRDYDSGWVWVDFSRVQVAGSVIPCPMLDINRFRRNFSIRRCKAIHIRRSDRRSFSGV
jgi:hypothetical protein